MIWYLLRIALSEPGSQSERGELSVRDGCRRSDTGLAGVPEGA